MGDWRSKQSRLRLIGAELSGNRRQVRGITRQGCGKKALGMAQNQVVAVVSWGSDPNQGGTSA
ncbi:MAG: hypothetical protein KME12_23035 [Trichocoleus desertorum ATA4-8-CV12]|nr:hypothetical protein [Trichocoleus desertorum ATA4-8-CV12]MBW4490659.1 hypothetical protein [Trichocoleus desertorum ATA4-8-CV12]